MITAPFRQATATIKGAASTKGSGRNTAVSELIVAADETDSIIARDPKKMIQVKRYILPKNQIRSELARESPPSSWSEVQQILDKVGDMLTVFSARYRRVVFAIG